MIRTDTHRSHARIAVTVAALAGLALLVGAGSAAAAPGNANGNAGDAPADAGPPSELPGPVPDFVEGVLGSVNDFLSGSVDALGETVSDLTPGGSSETGSGPDG